MAEGEIKRGGTAEVVAVEEEVGVQEVVSEREAVGLDDVVAQGDGEVLKDHEKPAVPKEVP